MFIRHHGFSIVELIVAVAITMIFLSILIPGAMMLVHAVHALAGK
jgi:type II secretory pathway pseudopilin PulG